MGRLTSVIDPSGFTAKYAYTNLGYSDQMLDATSGLAYWTASAASPIYFAWGCFR